MKRETRLYGIVLYAVFAAVLCVLSPLSLPITAPPVTLSVFAICCASTVLGKSAWISTLLYLLLGALGMPVFASFAGGIGVFAGANGGFLIGYIPLALAVGISSERSKNTWKSLAFSLVGLIPLYTLGGVWYACLTGTGLLKGFAVSVLPFVLPDILKVYLGIACGKKIKSLIKRV